MKQMGVYIIRNNANQKIYVGSSVDVASRWAAHRHHLRKGAHRSIHLQRAWDKHGEGSFSFEVIEIVSDENKLIEREQFHFDKLKPFAGRGYNIAPIAGRTKGAKRTAEQIARMVQVHLGKKLSDEHRRAISERNKGRRHSSEAIEKMRAARLLHNAQRGRALTNRQKAALHRSGPDHPWFGRKHSIETRLRLSVAKSEPVLQYSRSGVLVGRHAAASLAAASVGLKRADSIYRSCLNPQKIAGGYHWAFEKDVSEAAPFAPSPRPRAPRPLHLIATAFSRRKQVLEVCPTTGAVIEHSSVTEAAESVSVRKTTISKACRLGNLVKGRAWRFDSTDRNVVS